MFCEEIRIKKGIFYISLCPLRILYNSKFMLMATSLVTNAVIVTRVHCSSLYGKHNTPFHGITKEQQTGHTFILPAIFITPTKTTRYKRYVKKKE